MSMELKPCPFCGGEASTSTHETESLWSHNIVTYTEVGCDECGVSFSSEPGFEVEAPQLWNTRTNSQDALIAELVEALQEVLRYRRGEGKYRFTGLTTSEREFAQFDAWQEVEAGCVATLAKVHPHVG
jgi:Lar family restriction alleviation protein